MINIQTTMREWWAKNFPDAVSDEAFLGVVEEVGELSHAELKHRQGIRGMDDPSKFEAAAKDAVGDILIFLNHYVELKGWDMEEIVRTTVAEVLPRDWQHDPRDATQGPPPIGLEDGSYVGPDGDPERG